MRTTFANELHKKMQSQNDIYLVTADLGFRMWDEIEKDFPDRFIKVGASEQLMMGICCGLAMDDKTAIAYSITPFLLSRPFEWIRNYVDHEDLNVKLVGSGRGEDYLHDGFTHWAGDDEKILSLFPNIRTYKPDTKEELINSLPDFLTYGPAYLNLKRS